MVSKLEQFVEGGYARELEESGYPAKAVVLRALVESFREDGMPEVFPDNSLETDSGDRLNEQLRDIKKIRVGLVNALAGVLFDNGDHFMTAITLNRKIARAVNQVGAKIADEIKVRDLLLPQGENSLEGTGFEKISGVNKKVKDQYNGLVLRLVENGKYVSIGEIRRDSLEDIVSRLHRSKASAVFAKNAFA